MTSLRAKASDAGEIYEGLSDLPDAFVYERLCQGDEHALRVLFDRYGRLVRRLAHNILNDHVEAEDVAQEVFMALWRKKDAWECSARFSTWLHRVAINRAIDHRRRLRDAPQAHETIMALSDRAVPAEQGANLEAQDAALSLSAMIAELPSAQSRALTFYYFRNLDIADIADRMLITPIAVRALLKRGRAGLKMRLEKRHGAKSRRIRPID